MKLYSYDDFKRHPMFNINVGLCENTAMIYSKSKLPFKPLTSYLSTARLILSYPIGINGYNKRISSISSNSDFYVTRSFRGRGIYLRNKTNNSLYIGMQDALRHNLYHRYCLWLKANNPDVIYPAPIDFL